MKFRKELLKNLKILSFQVAQAGMEKVVFDFLPKEIQQKDILFVTQNHRLQEFEKLLMDNAQNEILCATSSLIKNEFENSYHLIDYIRNNHSRRGASIQQTYVLLILTHRLQRMQLLMDVLDTDNAYDTRRFVEIF